MNTRDKTKMELWDAYDAKLNKFDGITLIRGFKKCEMLERSIRWTL